MKRTQITELLSNIKATFVSFFSIVMFVALGVGLFAGISWTAPALQDALDRVFNEGSLYDLSAQFPYGLTDADLDELRVVEGVSDLEAARSSFQQVEHENVTYTAKVMSLTERMNTALQVEGELPTHANEVALEANWARDHGYAVGDTISFIPDAGEFVATTGAAGASGEAAATETDADGMKRLTQATFTVTALMESPAYVAYADSSYGFSTIGSGAIDFLVFATPEAFDAAAYNQGYTDLFFRCDSLRNKATFGDDYKHTASELEQRVSELGNRLATQRYTNLHSTVEEKVAEGEQAIAEGESQLVSAQTQLVEGESQIVQGEEELANGQQQLAYLQQQLSSGYEQLQSGQSAYDVLAAQYEQARAALSQSQGMLNTLDAAKQRAETELAAAQAQWNVFNARDVQLREQRIAGEITEEDYQAQHAALNAEINAYCSGLTSRLSNELAAMGYGGFPTLSEYDLWSFESALISAREQLDGMENTVIEVNGTSMTVGEAREKVRAGAAQLAEQYPQLAAAAEALTQKWNEYYAGAAQIQSAQVQAQEGAAQLESAKQQLEDGRRQYDEGVTQLEEHKEQLESGKQQLAAMKEFSLVVMTREFNGGVQMASTFCSVTNNLRFSMAALFVIVGLLVCYSAVSRIVHEQVVQIGTKKALGLRGREITLSFLLYSALAVVAGAVIGLAVGTTVVEGILSGVLGARFITGAYPPFFSLWQALLVTGIELGLILLATWFACHKVLKEHAISLLAGAKPPSAKPRFFEKWSLWNRLPLFTQTIVNNCLNDTRRVVGTIVGVAGCTALIVTAVTLNNDVLASFSRQYEQVYSFNAIAYFDEGKQGAQESIEHALDNQGARYAAAYSGRYTLEQPDGTQSLATVTVPQNAEAFQELYRVLPLQGVSENVNLGSDGVWMSRAYADHLGAKAGDAVTLTESTGEVHHLTIAGFFQYYLTSHQIVMSQDLYTSSFGTDAVPNALLVDTQGVSVSDTTQNLSGINGFAALSDDYTKGQADFNSFAQVSRTVVAIYLALSVLMAVVVLLNLNVMFIEEKKRELIVLMINGFSVRDAKGYIYRDTIVLTILGIVAGVVLGAAMGYVTVLSIEPASASFVKDIDMIACAVGAGGSAVMATAMSLIALRRISHFELTDINRF